MENERYAAEMLRAIGMSPKYKGYAYILFMLRLISENPARTQNLSLMLYQAVCARFRVSVATVERNVRFTIRRTWERDEDGRMRRLFQSYGISYVPTNRECVCVLADRMLHGGISSSLRHTAL